MQKPYPGLEIPESIKREKREWLVQRITWPLLFGLLIAITLGLLGDGPLSKRTARAADGTLQIEYERFLRYRSPDKLRITAQTIPGQIAIQLDNRYVRNVEISNVTPMPEHVVPARDGLLFVFNVASPEPVNITFEIRAEQIGAMKGGIALAGHSPVTFHQFVYP